MFWLSTSVAFGTRVAAGVSDTSAERAAGLHDDVGRLDRAPVFDQDAAELGAAVVGVRGDERVALTHGNVRELERTVGACAGDHVLRAVHVLGQEVEALGPEQGQDHLRVVDGAAGLVGHAASEVAEAREHRRLGVRLYVDLRRDGRDLPFGPSRQVGDPRQGGFGRLARVRCGLVSAPLDRGCIRGGRGSLVAIQDEEKAASGHGNEEEDDEGFHWNVRKRLSEVCSGSCQAGRTGGSEGSSR